ncbi:CBS domain-containing protein [Marivirga harenae]|uniref:CBS domain-containing protein n=1 Tax=Marivirga harenae TaxID=2010992 RepID=UPI0026DEF5BB|nr:CBS domain-containing protein [Marivirga harenae]WKV13493.1 CBS domain-containing protein [Marivirga harenae]|tara:strand:- start:110724 stop:111194 length:471 start_codon:yes stop_codon:yes gene_type:complete
MVKSYQGAFIKKESKQQEQKSVSVADYMARNLITFNQHQTIYEAMDILMKKKISGGPVVDEENNLIGVISEGDCLKEIVKGKYNNSPKLPGLVKDYMATNIIHIDPDTNIFEAANMFLRMRFRRFPVLKEGKLVGQISQRDIMRAVRDSQEVNWKH